MNTPPSSQKHVHVIGISGVATSALAAAFHLNGWRVTGSDKGFFPPASTELERQGISFYAGWHPDKMIEHGTPDMVIVGTASGSQNPETQYATDHHVPIYSFAEAIGKFFVKEHSIVVTGTWGKTSSSALLSHILDIAGFDPTYMFGGISLSHTSSARLTASHWNVFEGDEYKSSPTDPTAKFFYYKPTHLILTAVSWDHADLYPTEQSYFDTFHKLITQLPSTGLIVANADNEGVSRSISDAPCRVVHYGSKEADYTYSSVSQTHESLSFTITHKNTSYQITSPMIGAFQAENITGCFAMAHTLGIAPDVIQKAIMSFQGMKRRLEKRLDGDVSPCGITVFDDIAHSPEKASSVLKTLRSVYDKKIIVIFEPNIGGRRREALTKYDHAFDNADTIIIPRLTTLKVADDATQEALDGQELADAIAQTHSHCIHITDDAELVTFLTTHSKKGDVIAFLGSHGFRRMIEETVTRMTS
jgi:UDP-N-acetylmuramate: L-alanyl-gamma-D-glutamyl-meso-diaminopimelate ligase